MTIDGHRVPRPAFKWEWNITTVIAILGIVAGTIGYFQQQARTETTMQAMNDRQQIVIDRLATDAIAWRTGHETLHKERAADLAGSFARVDERLKKAEEEYRSLDNIRYRMAVLEQAAAAQSKLADDQRRELSQLTSDIRLIREIVTRLDPGPQDKRRP